MCFSTALLRDRVYIVLGTHLEKLFAGAADLYAPDHHFANLEIHKVFLRFSKLDPCQNLSLSSQKPFRRSAQPMLPWAGWALTPPFQPYLADSCESAGRYISVALVLGSPPAGVTRYPCPVKPGLSSSASFRIASAAVRPGRREYCTAKKANCQILLQILFKMYIL